MVAKLKKLYNKSLFQPTLFGLFFNPFFIIRRGLYNGVAQFSGHLHGKLLDFGCGSKPYKALFAVSEYVGADIEVSGHDHRSEEIDVYYDGNTLPFADESFDSIFSSEVFEHVFNLPQILDELHRVLKPGGKMLITVPFVWDEHEIPYDFARYTSFGLKHILQEKGFVVVQEKKTTNYVSTTCQMWAAYVYQHIFPKHKGTRIALTPLFITPITLCGLLLSAILPKNMNFFHNNVMVVQKPAERSNS
ncbi:class I SAM-dependent methyltransferase [Parapedobacter sp. 10938]|uniref:class I SAM-dependent methyltransferase n=1 Tax=Parapedobacter flavus TaxID=3110225 RepID=UPI002DBFB91F|nr:methyltransferase domain-containing protein [Parapedobacter sp. 10938]MEC3877991.1 methyltransferase domain-containing protein [Parapedobacter sp. 10938]